MSLETDTPVYIKEIILKSRERFDRNKDCVDFISQLIDTASAIGYIHYWIHCFSDEPEIIQKLKELK